MANQVRAFVVRDGDGEKIQGPPEHIDVREDEVYYILDGQPRFKADGELLDAPTGSLVSIPRGTPHCFQNTGQGSGQAAGDVHSGGHGAVLRGNAKLPPGPFDPQAYPAVAHSAWMEVVGKPLSEGGALS